MGNRRRDDFDEDELDDAELNDDDYDDFDDDDEVTVACPYCRRQIHEDSERCPYCERYISAEDRPAERKPWWVILGVIVCLYIVWRWMTP